MTISGSIKIKAGLSKKLKRFGHFILRLLKEVSDKIIALVILIKQNPKQTLKHFYLLI